MKNITTLLVLGLILNHFHLTAQTPCEPNTWQERNGIAIVEMENHTNLNGWVLDTTVAGYTGTGTIMWKNAQLLNGVTDGKITYKIKITTPGKYIFDWRTSVNFGTLPTDHNDTWLSITGVDNFYAQRNITPTTLVKPKPTCNNDPVYVCPAGTTASNYFKIYTGGKVSAYVWQAHTSDNDPHTIYFEKNTEGVISINIAARSSYHAIDRLVIYRVPQVTQAAARSLSLLQKDYLCSTTPTNELPERSFQIYPNPANQQLMVKTEMSGQVDIMGINGILHKTLKVSEGNQNIGISDLSKGIYWVRFMSNDQMKIRKLVVN